MRAITIRSLSDVVHDGLRQRARAENLSVEALVRKLLAEATRQETAQVITPPLSGFAEASAPWGELPAISTVGRLWGALSGCMTLQTGVDLAAPLDEAWQAAE